MQSHEGDCLLLEHEYRDKRRFVLVDGGPRRTYDPHLERTLRNRVRRNGGILDLVVLSHVDADHVVGLLDLFVELRSAASEGDDPLVRIKQLWHNTFGLLDSNGRIATRFAAIMATANAMRSGQSMTNVRRASLALADRALASIRQGERLGREARLLRVPTNQSFGGDPAVANAQSQPVKVGGLSIRVVGPTQSNLRKLRREWKEWLDEQEKRLRTGQFSLAAMADKSVPNLSSIQLLIERSGKSILFTGDGRGDHLIEALQQGGLMAGNGIDVDVLKVPHHGSDRNATRAFFETVRAKTYVISANGKHGNPDGATLEWIVDAAKSQGRKITIALTNETPSVKKLRTRRPENRYGYRLRILREDRHYLSLRV